jgi:subtilisin family serine protease
VQRRCDVVNLSLGGFYVTPSPLLASAVAAATNADIIMTAAQGNDDSATQDGARLFNTASPGATKRVLSVGHVNNTATLGAVLQLDRAIDTPSGKRSTLCEWQLRSHRCPHCCSRQQAP